VRQRLRERRRRAGVSTQPVPAPATVVLRGSRGRTTELVVKALLGVCALISVLTTIGIVFALLLPAIDFFREVSPLEFFLGTVWRPLFEPASFGVLPLVTATFTVTGWAMLVAVPAGLGTAIYLSEYASTRARNTLKPIVEILAGIPTVVLGYFALTAVTPLLRQIGIEVEIFNVLSGGLVVGVMLIPTIASLSEDAMSAVPQALRDGSYGLGADKLQTSLRVVVPAAVSGIIASFVLAISRAVGETVIALIAIGQLARITGDPTLGASTLTAFIGATGNGDLPAGSIEYKTIFAVGLTLFAITFVTNMISIRLVRRFREVYD
jgi:phosphate transport system permease protein